MTYKTQFKILGIVAISALIIFNIYWFGWLKLKDSIYQQGFSAGKTEGQTQIISDITSQLCQSGKADWKLYLNDAMRCDSAGQLKDIILMPQLKQ